MGLVIFSFFYNRSQGVNNSVDSLLKAAPNSSRIILINDGSTDDTLKELEKFKFDNRVTIINQNNKGFSNSLYYIVNQYLMEHDFKYIAIHGSGDLAKKEKFEKQLDFLNNNTNVVAVGTGHETRSATNNILLRSDKGYRKIRRSDLYNGVPFTHGTVMYRVTDFLKVGGYNPQFKYCQDWDLYFKLIDYGEIIRLPEVLYTKFVFNDGASFKPSKSAKQIKYKNLVLTREHSEEYYNYMLNNVIKYGIDEVYPDSCFKKEYKKSQISLILKGELKLAIEWNKIIYRKNNFLINWILKLLIFLKIPVLLIANIYIILVKIKKIVKKLKLKFDLE